MRFVTFSVSLSFVRIFFLRIQPKKKLRSLLKKTVFGKQLFQKKIEAINSLKGLKTYRGFRNKKNYQYAVNVQEVMHALVGKFKKKSFFKGSYLYDNSIKKTELNYQYWTPTPKIKLTFLLRTYFF